MKLSQLSLADYNQLDSIPVINQDLSATDFTPVANTYYRHTGATTDTFTQGVIYLYDTAYHKLGESGGGTTLNRYEYDVNLSSTSYSIRNRIINIATKAVKYSMYATLNITTSESYAATLDGYLLFGEYSYAYSGVLNSGDIIGTVFIINFGDHIGKTGYVVKNNTITSISTWKSINLKIIYYSDTEITE